MASYIDDLRDKQKIRDQLGREDTNFMIFDQFTEDLQAQELTTVITSGSIGQDLITSHQTNGVMNLEGEGTASGDYLLMLPGMSEGTYVTPEAVVSPYNRFIEYFRGTSFVGTATTATVNTTDFSVTF